MPRILLAPLLLAACSAPLERHAYEDAAMGTSFRIVLYARDEASGAAAAADAFARIRALDATFSDYDPRSEARRLAALGAGTHAASDGLCEVTALALDLSRASAGAFDVTVGPLTRLWRRAVRRGIAPDPARLAEARSAVGAGLLGVERSAAGGALTLRAGGMRLDYGGIAKGYALDEALRVLAGHGVERALVDGGGDVACGAPPPGADGWLVAVELPDGAAAVRLAHAAVATSGDLARGGEVGGVPRSHVIDPRTGAALDARPRRASAIARRVARPGAVADAVASALLVLGADDGLALAAALPGVEALYAADGRLRTTAGFPALVSSPAAGARAGGPAPPGSPRPLSPDPP